MNQYFEKYNFYKKCKVYACFFIVLSIGVFAVKDVHAQTEPMYAQYMYNMLAVNPAYAGNREATNFNFFQRRQWVGLKGAPQTTALSLDGSAYNGKMGLAVQLYDDRLGIEKASGATYTMSTRIRVSDKGILSGGLNVGMMNYRIDLLNVSNRVTPSDPAFYSNMNKWLPSLGMGIFYNTDNMYIGASMPNVLRSRLTAIDLIRSGLQKINNQHVFLNAGFVVSLNEDIKLKPSTMIKMVSGAPIQADINTNIWLKDILGFGVSYRTGDAILSMLELQATSNLRLGYAYEHTISELKYYNSGSHEIMLRYEFGNAIQKIKSTRYF